MLQKTTLGIAIVAVILAIASFFIPHGSSSSPTLGYSGAGATFNSVQLTPSSSYNGGTDLYALGFNTFGNRYNSASATPEIDLNGNWVGNFLLSGYDGFGGPYTTSTAFTGAQMIASQNIRWLNTTAVATATLPAATTTYLAFNSLNFGSIYPFQVTNDSTNTVNYVAGASTTFKCETSGVGTSTVLGGCTSSQISILATSTVQGNLYWDGASSSEVIEWGNNFH